MNRRQLLGIFAGAPIAVASGFGPRADRIVVIGGGILGCATAYRLAKRGAEVTLCDQGPELVQFFKPLLRRRGALIAVSTSTWQEHTKKPGKTLLRVDADLLASTSSICEQLFSQGLSEGLVCDRPSADSWRPIRSSGGAVITGCSISLISEDSDWGLEVSLSLPEKE